ncbi:hypothetical protein Tco_0553781 [Tanacetum coccineum]
MEISIADQIALDDALVAPADRLKIGKCNLRLSSDVTSKEATLQVVYDVLKLTPFLQGIPSHFGNKKFEEPPLEKEILTFLASLGHSGEIRKITDVNVNKLHQPWRSFAAIINKCLSGKPYYASLRLFSLKFLWDREQSSKKGNAIVLSSFHQVSRQLCHGNDLHSSQEQVNWHYARDDPMFTTINVISRNEDTQLYGTILPEQFLQRQKGSKKKANTDTTTKQKPPTVPKEKKEKKSGKGKQKTTELENISEAVLTEAEHQC